MKTKEKKAKKEEVQGQETEAPKTVLHETSDILSTLLDLATPATPVSAPADGEKHYQFTKRAHYRVMNSYHTKRLWEMFNGQYDVDLPAVEWAVLSFEKERGPAEKKLEADVASVGTLVMCDFQMSVPCLNLGHEFLPRTWISKQGKGKQTGNYTGSIEDRLMAACEKCKQVYAEYCNENNEPYPYYTSREEVEAYLERQRSRGELTQSLRGQMEKIRAGMRKPSGDRR